MEDSKKTLKLDFISLSTHHLIAGLKSTDTVIAYFTGFTYRFNNDIYLITNWHNFSGKNPITGEWLSKTCAIPDIISIALRDKLTLNVKRKLFDLYYDEDMLKPKWLVHPNHGNSIDVVAIKLEPDFLEDRRVHPINDYKFDTQFAPIVSDDVFIIGYPFNELQLLELPVWKGGSIATEPEVDIDRLPKMLVDTATRSGMSGSPVIFNRSGMHNPSKEFALDSMIGTIQNFIGVYSGRIGKDEFQAQLGIVWKHKVIDEIIKGQVLAERIIP